MNAKELAKELRELFSSSAALFERPDTLQIDIEEIIHYGTLSGVGVGSPLEPSPCFYPNPTIFRTRFRITTKQ